LPRQFGEVEPVVFARDVVSKTLALFLQQSTKAEVGISAYWSVNTVEETITVLALEDGAYIAHGVCRCRCETATSALLTGFPVRVDAVREAE